MSYIASGASMGWDPSINPGAAGPVRLIGSRPINLVLEAEWRRRAAQRRQTAQRGGWNPKWGPRGEWKTDKWGRPMSSGPSSSDSRWGAMMKQAVDQATQRKASATTSFRAATTEAEAAVAIDEVAKAGAEEAVAKAAEPEKKLPTTAIIAAAAVLAVLLLK